MTERPTVHIAAGGNGTRIRKGMENMGFPAGFPKHLLPTGGGETLLGRIVRQATAIGHPEIYANYDNARAIGEQLEANSNHEDITLSIAWNCNGPLSPLVHAINRSKQQTLACAGDFWADFSWADFRDFHDSQPTPVSILVGPSVPTREGAVFHVGDNGIVQSWDRVEQTTEEDMINIGAYIVDPEKLVLQKLRALTHHKEDPFNTTMIEGGLMSAYVLDSRAYNVNNPEVYAELVQANAQQR